MSFRSVAQAEHPLQLGDASLVAFTLLVELEEGVGLLEEVGLPVREQVGAECVLAARLGRGRLAGEGVEDDLGPELGREATTFPHRGEPPIEQVTSLCTWSDS